MKRPMKMDGIGENEMIKCFGCVESALMAEYIEREALLRWIEEFGPANKSTIINAPAADVAPVVRCKDCKYHDLEQEPRRCESLGNCILMGAMTPDEGFCYLAKRRG